MILVFFKARSQASVEPVVIRYDVRWAVPVYS